MLFYSVHVVYLTLLCNDSFESKNERKNNRMEQQTCQSAAITERHLAITAGSGAARTLHREHAHICKDLYRLAKPTLIKIKISNNVFFFKCKI